MKAFVRTAIIAGLALTAGAAAAVVAPVAVQAATPSLPSLVAYVRDGNVYVSKGSTEKRITTGGGHARPRFSRDGSRIAVLRNNQLWVMKSDGTAARRLTTRAAAGASWSPDGASIAFASLGCTGGPAVYRISATVAGAQPQVLFPAECRTEPLPAEQPVEPAQAGALADKLRGDDAVAWSPDGRQVAFRGGMCESMYDTCLTVGTIATGGERTVAAYGGGSRQNSGFAVVPTWRKDGKKLAWTAYEEGETAAQDRPVHVVEYDPATGAKRFVGATLDRELSYSGTGSALVTGQYQGGSWVMVLNLATGARTPFHAGSQPSVQGA
jgi:Tol biopolymer transport system component